MALETADASGVRPAGCLAPEDAKDENRSWLVGWVWAAARASGLQWGRARAAEVLRTRPQGWEQASARVVGSPGSETFRNFLPGA